MEQTTPHQRIRPFRHADPPLRPRKPRAKTLADPRGTTDIARQGRATFAEYERHEMVGMFGGITAMAERLLGAVKGYARTDGRTEYDT